MVQVWDALLAQVEWMFSQPATLELTHNWGTENDDDYKNATGNEDPKGYGVQRLTNSRNLVGCAVGRHSTPALWCFVWHAEIGCT